MAKFTLQMKLRSIERVQNPRTNAVHLVGESEHITRCRVPVGSGWIRIEPGDTITCHSCLVYREIDPLVEDYRNWAGDRKIEIEITDSISIFV